MSPLLKHLFKLDHEETVSAIADALRGQRWDVMREPIVDAVRPDLVAQGPGGETVVIEVKQGDGRGNLGAVAQVEAYRNAVAREAGSEAKGVLVLAGEVPVGLGAAAEQAGVELIVTGSGNVASVRDALARSTAFGYSIR